MFLFLQRQLSRRPTSLRYAHQLCGLVQTKTAYVSSQAHNFFLYPLVFYGIAGLAILFVLLKKFFIGAFVPDLFVYLPILPMIIFNDRFINLNIYPVILYLVLITRYDEIQIFGFHDRVE